MRASLARLLTSTLLVLSGAVGVNVIAATPAAADTCFTWTRNLSQGDSGNDVKQLQIRIAGWMSYGETLAIDGIFGPATANAVQRFKAGYNIDSTTGTAGSGVFDKLYALQDADCTPIHFAYSEFDDSCGENDYTGGAVDSTTAKSNILWLMWQLEAMRHKLGDRAMVISSGFRSLSCNSSVGGAAGSLHTYGKAADFSTASGPTLCEMWRAARYAGFKEILGPGYPGHNDHTHVGNKSSQFWSAPNC